MASRLAEKMKSMNKEAGEEIIKVGLSEFRYDRIPFTSPKMNYCTYGGIPRGKLIEFFGEEHGGKTTTALDIVANFQQIEQNRADEDVTYEPQEVLYVDAENTLDVEWATKLGVDVDNITILAPKAQSAEWVFDKVLELIGTGFVGLVVIDSLPSLCSQQELDKDVQDATYCGISTPLTKFARKAEGLAARHNCTIIGINQIRDNLNSTWGGVKTPGGRAWRHFCMVRIQFTKGAYLNEKGEEIKRSSENPAGNVVLMSMEKNKSCPLNRKVGSYTINYDFGTDYLRDLVDIAIFFGIIDKTGGWYTIIDSDTGEILEKLQGFAKVNAFLADDDNVDVLSKIELLVDQKIGM